MLKDKFSAGNFEKSYKSDFSHENDNYSEEKPLQENNLPSED